ncbi:hypothetical protein LJC61_02725 [Ruminococcaceae bacterium OttesenSCG-928-A16]|nr:hypothetical protein [Ruminococcaceae bacterium OttesenSCG-928-A16]
MANTATKSQKLKREELRKDLLEKIESRWPESPMFIDLAEDYLSLWDDKRTLRNDIAKRGRKVTKYDSRGQKQIANNESIDQILKINTQMINIIKAIGLEPSLYASDDDDLV